MLKSNASFSEVSMNHDNDKNFIIQVRIDPPLKSIIDPVCVPEFDALLTPAMSLPVTKVHGKGIIVHGHLDETDAKTLVEAKMGQSGMFNKNMLSFTEKFLSDTEVSQVTKEEFQSVFKELQTIHAEQQLQIEILTEVNDDLFNSFRSSVSSHLFVDENLVLKRYFSVSLQHIDLKSTDIGRPLYELSTNIKFCALIEDIKTVIKSGGVLIKEVQSDDERWYNLLAMPYIRQEDNKIDGAIISIKEITSIKKIQKNLDDRNASLKRINEDFDNFVYTASRHLIAPLSNLEGLIELLKVKLQSGNTDIFNVIEMVQNALGQFKITISDLDEIGNIESEMLRDPDHINFELLVEDVKFSIQDQIDSSNATITTEFAEKKINFSKKSLRSIFYHLITNSIKFRSPLRNPELYITTYAVPGYIVLMLKDNGLGIPQDKIHTIFQKHKFLLDDTHGQGLGLFLVKKIVDASGGEVEVESLPGEGTVFRVFLRYDFHIH